MNPPNTNTFKLGPAVRNICDELINQINIAVNQLSMSKLEKGEKIREFKDKIKADFHPLLKQVIKSLKNIVKADEGISAINCLNGFYIVMNSIVESFSFLHNMSSIYDFPEFNLNDTIDFIFEGCSNDLKQKLVDSTSLDYIMSKNLYDDNDVRLLINNDFNNTDYNDEVRNPSEQNINIFSDKNNPICKNIIKNISNKIDEINNIIISTKDGFNEDNFKLYYDETLCLKIYNNLDIKFILTRLYFNTQFQIPEINIPYIILPIEIQYNNQKINLNDNEEKLYNKNNLVLTKDDLQFLINKFKPKKDFSDVKDVVIGSLNKNDFLEKCILFKKFTKELFNNKFESIKKEIKSFINKYDFPLKFEEQDNSNMELENKDDIKDTNSINEIIIYYNFSINMKKKNEFYIKLIYDKERPTNIKLVYSHYALTINDKSNQKLLFNLFIEDKELEVKLDKKAIKNEIIHCYDINKRILMNWIIKKLKYIYPIYFDFNFIMINYTCQIIFAIKNNEKLIKIFSISINDKGKLLFENLFSSKLFNDDFKEISSIITNYLKCGEDDEKSDEYIIQFNNYIKYIIIEKVFTFTEDKIKLIEFNSDKGIFNIHVYDSYCIDKNFDTYFNIKCSLHKDKNDIIKKFNLSEINLICASTKNINEKIILNCNCKKYQIKTQTIEEYEEYFRSLINELKIKYRLYMTYAYDTLKLAELPQSVFEFKKPLILKENDAIDNKEIAQWIEIDMNKDIWNITKKVYKDKLMIYFNKIKISKDNNIFKFYLNENIFKGKYSKIRNLIFQKYAQMIQNIIIGYDSSEDAISITILGKMKLEYSNKIRLVFEDLIGKMISFMENIFKLIDRLLKYNHASVLKLCPVYAEIQISYENFKQNLNYKFNYDKPYFSTDGNFNLIIKKFLIKYFGENLILKEQNNNDKDFFINKWKFFYLNYKFYDLFINHYKFKVSVIEYPFNHFQPENSNIYFILKEYNIFQLMTLNNLLLIIQIRDDNNIYLEFHDKINEDIENDLFSIFKNELVKTNIDFKINYEQMNKYNKMIIYVDDEGVDNKFFKVNEIIKIFIVLSKSN